MGCCVCKKVLKILAGLALIGASMGYIAVNQWLILGAFLLLVGVAPFVCGCEGSCCTMDTKKKK